MRQFDDRPRHMVVRRHHDQRLETAFVRPASRLGRIAAGVDRGAVEIDAAAHERLVVGQGTGNVAGCAGRMHAGDQQALAVTVGQQFHRVGHPRRAAREHDDAVGGPRGFRLGPAQLRKEAHEADRGGHERGRQHHNRRRPQPATRRGNRFIVGRPAHDDLAILSHPSLEVFWAMWSPEAHGIAASINFVERRE